jgi:hypothetical protein
MSLPKAHYLDSGAPATRASSQNGNAQRVMRERAA